MLENGKLQGNSDDCEWALQSEIWISENLKLQRPRKLRERNSNPLILTGHGTSMRISKGTLIIKEGFTHYPHKQSIYRYFKGDLNCPTRILLLDGSGTLSFDVLDWLSQQGISLIRIDWTGNIAIAVNSSGYAYDRQLVNWQYDTRDNHDARLAYAIGLITRKLENSVIALNSIVPHSDKRDNAITKAVKGIAELQTPISNMTEIRTIEGICASAYFHSWKAIRLNWKAETKYPIPEDWRRYHARSSVLTGRKPHNYKASHPINAMLNYAYTVKSAHLQIEAIAKGYDPTVGIMHHEGKGRAKGKPAYIFDLIEPERPKVDAAIMEFAMQYTFSGADFIIREDGVCRLSPQLAKVVVGVVLRILIK